MTVPIAGPDPKPESITHRLPQNACDCHAHIFGPEEIFPFADGRGYTPPDAPVEAYLGLLDALGCARGGVVQGNAHGYDNRAILDWLRRYPQRLRGVAITDAQVDMTELRSGIAPACADCASTCSIQTAAPITARALAWTCFD